MVGPMAPWAAQVLGLSAQVRWWKIPTSVVPPWNVMWWCTWRLADAFGLLTWPGHLSPRGAFGANVRTDVRPERAPRL